MARRLSPTELQQARRDPRYRPQLWPRNRKRNTNVAERELARILADLGIRFKHEPLLLPTLIRSGVHKGRLVTIRHGITPDFALPGQATLHQTAHFIEVGSGNNATKRIQIANAEAIYDVNILLVDDCLLDSISDNPALLTDWLESKTRERANVPLAA